MPQRAPIYASYEIYFCGTSTYQNFELERDIQNIMPGGCVKDRSGDLTRPIPIKSGMSHAEDSCFAVQRWIPFEI